MTTITIVCTDNSTSNIITNADYESVRFYCREMVEHNSNIKQIVVDFKEGKIIFEKIY